MATTIVEKIDLILKTLDELADKVVELEEKVHTLTTDSYGTGMREIDPYEDDYDELMG